MKAILSNDAGADWRDSMTWYTHDTPMFHLIKSLTGLVLPPLSRVECTGLENIPATGPCVLAVNHLSNWDVLFLGLYLSRHPYYMSKVELFKNPILGWAIRLGGAFPIYRGESDAWALQQAGRILAAGQMLCMFPEGTRSKDKAQLRRGKSGAVKLALDYQSPIVPTAIIGTQNFRLGWRANQVYLRVGQPLDIVALAGAPPYERDTLRQLTTLLMQRIAEMLPPENRGVYA
jgi:1-acyl-sn-glycerol-3-phosphate acyltransferase